MSSKRRAWLLIAVLAGACGLLAWGFVRYRAAGATPAYLLKRMPAADALVIYVDFAALRAGGLLKSLNASRVSQDPEYVDFVRATEFDYTRDLDSAMIALAPGGKYLFVKGRFDWPRLESYVQRGSGHCLSGFCEIEGSAPERRISFFPVRSNLMALAVAADRSAALSLRNARPGPDTDVPDAPVWFSIPASVLKSGDSLPAGTRMFARGMERAESVTLAFAQDGPRFGARLDVRCADDQEAAELVSQLRHTTELLRAMIAREQQTPNPADLSGVLTSGSFRNEGRSVVGQWPIERAFLENLLGGGSE